MASFRKKAFTCSFLNVLLFITTLLPPSSSTTITNDDIKLYVKDYLANGSTNYGPIESWNTSQVTDMTELFQNKWKFQENISAWDVSNVTDMMNMFQNAAFFSADISLWVVSNVTNMKNMFHNASSFNGDIKDWDVSNVTNMMDMFHSAASFNSELSQWGVSNVTNMKSMFLNATSFNTNITDWNVSNVQIMVKMFEGATSFNQSLCWNTMKVRKRQDMFTDSSGTLEVKYVECEVPTKSPTVTKSNSPALPSPPNSNTMDNYTIVAVFFVGLFILFIIALWMRHKRRRTMQHLLLAGAHSDLFMSDDIEFDEFT